MLLPRKEKTFSDLFSAFLKWRWNFEYFQKKMTTIADIFPKLQIPKNAIK